MKAKPLLIALTGLALSMACADALAAACPGPVCQVKITLPSGCDSLKVDPDEVHIAKNKTVTIQWEIDPKDPWEFTGSGITFKEQQSAWGVFSDPKKTGKRFTWKDKNQKAANYPYTVEVKDASGKICRKDPTVVNE